MKTKKTPPMRLTPVRRTIRPSVTPLAKRDKSRAKNVQPHTPQAQALYPPLLAGEGRGEGRLKGVRRPHNLWGPLTLALSQRERELRHRGACRLTRVRTRTACHPEWSCDPGLSGRRRLPDRKSTRLNSSHLVISYA